MWTDRKKDEQEQEKASAKPSRNPDKRDDRTEFNYRLFGRTTEQTDLTFFFLLFASDKAFLHRAARNGCTKICLVAASNTFTHMRNLPL